MVVLGLSLALCASGTAPTPPAGEPTPPGGEPTPPAAEPAPPGGEPAPPGAAPTEAAPTPRQLGAISWQDIVTVPRRPILKYHRVELIPTYNVSINDNLYRHHGFGGIINFFLSETLSIGLEGTYYVPQQLEHYFLRGLDDRVLPSVNKHIWSATFNFAYVPIYGKLALFNKWIFQWEAYIQAGIGVLETTWITRDPANQPGAPNLFDVLWHVDLGTRLFLTKWLALHVYIKDYMFVDKFEPTVPRTGTQTPPDSTWVSQFVQNIVFGVGIGMFLPTGFEYKYTR
jgi:outer membrane beta-barrel protein